MEKLPSKFQHILTQGKIVTGNSRAFIGTLDSVKEVQIGDRPVRYLTSEEYNSLSDEEKMKDIAYMVPDLNQELAIYHHSNPNLLINADFRRPVNTRGMSSYSSYTESIDRWWLQYGTSLTVMDGYVQLSGDWQVFQKYRNGLPLGTYTFSALVRKARSTGDNNVTIGFSRSYVNHAEDGISSTAVPIATLSGDTWELISNTTTSDEIKMVGIGFSYSIDGSSFDILAAKLELGSTQTLAHKEGDTWVLNDPPNYDLQYALCSQYNSYNGNWIGYPFHNENLLDNWYFVDPINQRGETTYSGVRYGIDRWLNSNSGSYTLSSYGLDFGTSVMLDQRIEPGVLKIGQVVTASILTTVGLYSCTRAVADQDWAPFPFDDIKLSIRVTANGTNAGVFSVGSPDDVVPPRSVIAVKLEYGSTQTLAHKEGDTWVLNDPPLDRAVELLKCQRYYYQSWVGDPSQISMEGSVTGAAMSETRTTTLQFPVEMRTTPSMSLYSAIDGSSGTANEWNSDSPIPVWTIYKNNKSFKLGNSTEQTFEVGKFYQFHYSASADL